MNIKPLKKTKRIWNTMRTRKDVEFPAFLGNHNGVVKADERGNVYVTLFSGDVMTVYNARVPNKPRLPVVIGYEATNENLLQVLRSRDVYANGSSQPDVPDHNHTWGRSTNVTWVRGEQFLPGLVTPNAGEISVHYTGLVYWLDGAFRIVPEQDIDLSANIPASGAIFAILEVDDIGVISVLEGTPVDGPGLLTYADIPDPSTDKKPLMYAVKLYADQEQINQGFSFADSDLVDLRWSGYGAGGAVGGVESVTGDLVDNTDPLNPVVDPPTSSQIVTALNNYSVPITKLDIASAAEIAGGLADVDEIIVNKASSGTIYKAYMTRLWSYIKNKVTGAVSAILESNLTASRAVVSDGSGKVSASSVTATEVGYLSGVSSALQTQIDGKAASGGWNTVGSTLSIRSQAYTNDPAAGDLVTLNMTDTSKFFVGGGCIVSSSAGAEMAIITSLVANTSITVSTLSLNHTTTNPVVIAFAVGTSGDETANIQKGDKFRLTQSGDKYFVVYSVTSSVITFIPTSTNLLTTGAVTAGYFSHIENPMGWVGALSYQTRIWRATTDFTNKPTFNALSYSVIGNLVQGTIDFTIPTSPGGAGGVLALTPTLVATNGTDFGMEIVASAQSYSITANSSSHAFSFYKVYPIGDLDINTGWRYSGRFRYLF